MFGYHAKHNRAVCAARQRLAGKRVRRIDAVFQEDVLNFHEPGSWVFAEGALRDSGVNAISILVSLTAE
jgi:hypothetical protein